MSRRTSRPVAKMTLAASVAAMTAAVTAVIAPTAMAHAAPATAHAARKAPIVDFNGDSYADMAVGAPDGTVGSVTAAGYVSVVYGGAGGVDATMHGVISQNTPGIPGGAEPGDHFGTTVVPIDLNKDGYTDLAVGAPGEDVGSGADAGLVTVLWGSPNGLVSGTAVDTGATAHGGVGNELAAGDFDGDGAPDLVTAGGDDDVRLLAGIGADGKVARPATIQLYRSAGILVSSHDLASGDVDGDGVADMVVVVSDQDEPDSLRGMIFLGGAAGFTSAGIAEDPSGARLSGETAAVGDVNGDGYGDIVIGHRDDQYDSDQDLPVKGGAVGIAYGGPGGRSSTVTSAWINQDTAGVPGVSEFSDEMGADVSVGDVNADGYADVIAGVPNESFDGITGAGSFLVLLGSAKGLTGAGSQVFSQNSAGLPGVAETDDEFGAKVAVIPATGSNRAQVAVGDPAENAGNGAVWVLHGTAAGLTGTNTANFGSASMGAPAAKAGFGTALSGD
jgi:FG-GAP repeat/FG-GAP-like repeat